MERNNESVINEVVSFLMDIVRLKTDEVLNKNPNELKSKHRKLVTWTEGKSGEFKAVPIDKIKAADLLLKYLAANEGKKDYRPVIIYGEGDIEE